MKPINFKYYFDGNECKLVEIKILDDSLTRDQKYHWLLYEKDSSSFSRLNFLKMGDGSRTFHQGDLTFDENNGSLTIGPKKYSLKNLSQSTPDNQFKERCSLYLNQN